MKQNIAVEQLGELNGYALSCLRRWCFDRFYFVAEEMLLSMGQLIEFLNEHGNIWISNNQIGKSFHKSNKKWHVSRPMDSKDIIAQRDFVNSDELCDLLWVAVKHILEQEVDN